MSVQFWRFCLHISVTKLRAHLREREYRFTAKCRLNCMWHTWKPTCDKWFSENRKQWDKTMSPMTILGSRIGRSSSVEKASRKNRRLTIPANPLSHLGQVTAFKLILEALCVIFPRHALDEAIADASWWAWWGEQKNCSQWKNKWMYNWWLVLSEHLDSEFFEFPILIALKCHRCFQETSI
jgi:hypothetical protein